MKKLLALLLAIISLTAVLTSCDVIKNIFDDGSSDTTGNSTLDGVLIEETDKSDGDLVWSGNTECYIIAEEETEDLSSLRQYLYALVGTAPDIISSENAVKEHEIVFGDVGRSISDTAYAKLDRAVDLYALREAGNSAFIIYAEGGSIAVAYSDAIARWAAVDYIKTYIKAAPLYINGVITVKSFDKIDFIVQNREAEREDEFAAIEEYLGKENTDALRNFYNLYDEDLYLLIANLYDPNIGGFYYSASARDTNGFLPDLESTGQSLAILDNSGLTEGYHEEYVKGEYRAWQNMIPDEMREQLLDYVINLQAEDGYFYHPQWASVSTSRRGRDAGWARTIITALGAQPNYPFIGDTDINGAGYNSDSSLVKPLGYSASDSVSAIVPTAAAEMESVAAWIEYLDNANISENSYSIFNNLSARVSEIKKAGLWDATLTWLEEHQYENGTWEPTVCYNSINGLMKVSAFWTENRPLPRAEAAVRSTLQVMELDNIEEITGITFVYNPWVVLANILPYCGDAEAELRSFIVTNAATYINGTFKKLGVFIKDDGGFSYNQDSSAHFSQEAYVAVEGTAESDVNATGIAISTLVKYMMPVLLHGTELEIPNIYGKYDTVYFLETIENLQGVIKKPYDGPEPDTETFDEFDASEGGVANGVTLYPGTSVSVNLNNETVDDDGNYKFFKSSIVSNPTGAATDLVLYMQSRVYDVDNNGKIDDNGKECASSSDGSGNAQFNIVNSTIVGNCFIFETDFMFEDYFGTGSPTAMQLMFNNGASYNPHNSVWFNFTASRDANGNPYLLMAENFAGADGVKNTNLVGAIPAGEWINLRIEMYKIYEADGKLSVKAKIFIDGNYICESDSSNYDTKTENYFDYVVNCVRFSCFRSSGSSMYLNNTYAAKMQKDYVPEVIDDSKVDTEVKAPSVYDFETKVTNGIYSETYSTQKVEEGKDRLTHQQTEVIFGDHGGYAYGMAFSLTSDPKDGTNWVLKLQSSNAGSAVAGQIDVDTEKEFGKRVHVLEFDYYFVNNSAASQNILQLDLLDVNGIKMGGSSTLIYNRVKGNASSTPVAGAFRISGNSSGQRLDSNTWYRIRIVIDSDNQAIHYHFSADNGVSWFVATAPGTINTGATIGTLRLICNTYNNTGVQYIDDIAYTVTDTVPEAEIIKNEMADAAQPTKKVVYDFENNAFPENTTEFKATATLKPDADSGATNYVAGTEAYDKAIAELGKDGSELLIKGIGTAYYIVDDPTGASGKVLQAVTHNGGGANAFVDVIGSKVSDTVNTLEITFDYYTDYNYWIANNLPTMRLMLWDGQYEPDDVAAERRLSFFAFPAGNSAAPAIKYQYNAGAGEGKETTKLQDAFKLGDKVLDSHTWYTVKVIINGGKQYTYLAERGGQFELIATANYSAELETLKFMRIHIGSYNNTGRQYYDNISYVMSDTFVDPTK